MFDDRPSFLGVPMAVITLVVGFGCAISGWIWMIRISRGLGQPDRVTWRRSALTDRPRPNLRLALEAVVCVAIAVVALIGLLALPLDAPRIRLRTIAAALIEGGALVGSIVAFGWILLTAWFGDDR
jgi:hypothetical protein